MEIKRFGNSEGKAMKHQHFDVGTVGFYGAYWACAGGSDCAVIAMIGLRVQP